MIEKVVIYTTSLDVGGAEKMLYKILKELKSQMPSSLNIVSLAGRGKIAPQIEQLGISVEGRKNFFSYAASIMRYSQARSFVGWMYHGAFFATLTYLISFKKEKKLTWHIRQTFYGFEWETPSTSLIIKCLAKLSPLATTITFNSRDSLKQHLKIGFKGDLRVVPNGFEIKTYREGELQKLRTRAREKLEITKDDFIIGLVARGHPMKNHKGIINSAQKIIDTIPNAKFLFAGRGVSINTPPFNNIPQKIVPHFILYDEISDVDTIYQAIDVHLLFSLWGDSFPNVVGEAILNDCIPLCIDIGEVKEIVNNNSDLILKDHSPDKLIDKIKHIRDMPPQQKEALKKDLAKNIRENYGIEKISKNFYSFFFT